MARFWFCVSDFWWTLEVIHDETWQDSFEKSGFTIGFLDGINLDQTRCVRVQGTIQSPAFFGSDAQGEMYFVQFDPCKPLPWGVSVLGDTWHVMLPEVMLPCCLNAVECRLFNLPCIFGTIFGDMLYWRWFSTDLASPITVTPAGWQFKTQKLTQKRLFFFQLFRCVSSLFLGILLDDEFISVPILVKEMMTKHWQNQFWLETETTNRTFRTAAVLNRCLRKRASRGEVPMLWCDRRPWKCHLWWDPWINDLGGNLSIHHVYQFLTCLFNVS